MKKIFYLFLILFLTSNKTFACDYTQPDKLKHMEYSRKGTVIITKTLSPLFWPIKPVKWIFNDKIQKIFPDNYVPQAIAGTLIFTAGMLKEFPYDALTPGDCDMCDLKADCIGIKNGIKETRAKKIKK
ncbi:MAG: hypothetical protein WCK67_12775 [bacterium]